MNEIELSLDEIDLSFDNRENDFKAIIKKNYKQYYEKLLNTNYISLILYK
jgi:hypothetical protein